MKKKESKSFPNQLKNALNSNYEIQSPARTAEKKAEAAWKRRGEKLALVELSSAFHYAF
jgi:hypothetical protein